MVNLACGKKNKKVESRCFCRLKMNNFIIHIINILLLSCLFSSFSFGQKNYFLNRTEIINDTTFFRNSSNHFISLYYPDARNMGRGNTSIADGHTNNGMKHNPALLAFERDNIAELKIVAGLPFETVSLGNYLDEADKNNYDQIAIANIKNSAKAYVLSGKTDEAKYQYYRDVLDGLEYAKEYFLEIVDDPENPRNHGMYFFGEGNAQLGNFGFSFSIYGESDVKGELGPLFTQLALYDFPQDYNDTEEIDLAMSELNAMLDYAVDEETGIVNPQVLPSIYSFSFLDMIGTIGYGLRVYDNLSLGLNLSFLSRRFSAQTIDATQFNDVMKEAFSDFNTNSSGLSVDIGAHYELKIGASVGISVQNLFANHKLSSETVMEFRGALIETDTDENGNIILNEKGDTALVSRVGKYSISYPVNFSIPVVTNFGFHYPINENWDVAADIFDIFQQDTKFEKYWGRLRIGSEYRVGFKRAKISLAFRAGMQDLWPTVGIGGTWRDFISLDAALYKDLRLDSPVALFQLTVIL
ncbi:MAG: hypothetical protein KAQ79_05115 [Cyclobacteriaceae bacterium]|nr:hypothetical protein [Cyclobacteriaceae bacterium]